MGPLLPGLRRAGRILRRSPRLTVVVVVTLALVISANTVVFSAVRALILEPFPFRDGGRLVMLFASEQECPRCTVAPADFMDWREQSTSFEHLAAYRSSPANLSGPDVADRARAYRVSLGFFTVLGAEAQVGRTLSPEVDRPDDRVAVLSHGLWSTRFGADPSIVDQEVRISGEPYRVVGVLRRHHAFPPMGDLWLPLELTSSQLATRVGSGLGVVARLRPGVRIEKAQAEMEAIAHRIALDHPATNQGRTAAVSTLHQVTTEEPRPYLLLLLGAVVFLLLIACANLANLMLVQITTRRQELAVRSALGAGRGRIGRQIFTEILLLALIGGAAGALLAMWGTELLRTSVPEHQARYIAGWSRIGLDTTVLGFTFATAVLTGFLFGLLPAWRVSRADLASTLREGARGPSGGGRRGGRARHVLVVAEIALALVLLAGAGLMLQSLLRMLQVDPGFQRDGALTLEVSLPGGHPEGSPMADFYEQALSRLRALPGVEAVAAINELPMSGGDSRILFGIEGRPRHPAEGVPRAGHRVVTPSYFGAMRIPLLGGRGFSEHDRAEAPLVVMVNQTLAERYFPGRDPLGQRLELAGSSHQVVGVVRDVRHLGPRAATGPEIYQPHAQAPVSTMMLLVRASGDPLALAGPVRREVGAVNPDAGVAEIRTMEQRVHEFLFPERVTTAMLGVFATIALLISTVGIYGVMSHAIAQRTQEMGLRMALGARRRDLLWLVLRQGLLLALTGVALGLVGAVLLTRLMTGLLHEVSALDPTTLAGVAATLGAVALVASYLPARRAARVDPMVALRAE